MFMSISFPFKEEHSPIFGKIRRPIAHVAIKHKKENIWRLATMIIDTGADYTLFPRFFAEALGVSLKSDCKEITTKGVGGKSNVYLLQRKIDVRIGTFHRKIPVGFFSSDYIPPLLGRQEFFETFKVVFEKFTTRFEEPQ